MFNISSRRNYTEFTAGSRRSSGSEFQTVGPATEKARAYISCCVMPNTYRRRRRDETVLSRRRRRCEHNWQLAHDDCRRIRSTIWKLTTQRLRLITPILTDIDNIFNNDVIMSSLLKRLSMSIKIHVVKRLSLFGQLPNCRPNPSAVVVS